MRIRTIVAAVALAALALLPVTGVALAEVDLDCKDFPNREAAQRNFEDDTSDPNDLDRDNDGQACETFPYPPRTAPNMPPADPSPPSNGESPRNTVGEDPIDYNDRQTPLVETGTDDGRIPQGAVETGGGGTAGSGDDSLPLLGAGLAGLAVGGALIAGRRALRSHR